MPEPIFRSSEGHTPKSANNVVDPDDVDTASPDFFEADTDEIETDTPELNQDEIDTETPERNEAETTESTLPPAKPGATVRAAPEKPKQTVGGCAKSVLMMFGIAAAVVIGIVAVAIYYLLFYTPQNTAF